MPLNHVILTSSSLLCLLIGLVLLALPISAVLIDPYADAVEVMTGGAVVRDMRLAAVVCQSEIDVVEGHPYAGASDEDGLRYGRETADRYV